jgi:hypothetical protein
VDPYFVDNGLLFLNPAAFSTPKPGTNGNLERNLIHGPNFYQVDMILSKKIGLGKGSNLELRAEVFNVFNTVNFDQATIGAALPNALPGANESATQANRTQPGLAYTAANAGTFGRATSTVGRTVGLGTARQAQFAFRLNF